MDNIPNRTGSPVEISNRDATKLPPLTPLKNDIKIKEITSLPRNPLSRSPSVYTLNGNPPVGPKPQKITCPHCGGYQLSTVVWRTTLKTHFTAMLCCLTGLWCLIPLPYFLKGFRHAFHYCKICGQFIESYPAQ